MMDTTCPGCGCTNSLDSLVAHLEGGEAFLAGLKLAGKLEKPLIKYLALFRPATRKLSYKRAAKLIEEMVPDILRGAISRNRIEYPAPAAAWVWAIERCLEARDQNRLTTPLKNHGYLYEVITSYKPEQAEQPHYETAPAASSLSTQIMAALKPMHKPAPTLRILAGKSNEEKNTILLENRQGLETLEETYKRMLQEQQQQEANP